MQLYKLIIFYYHIDLSSENIIESVLTNSNAISKQNEGTSRRDILKTAGITMTGVPLITGMASGERRRSRDSGRRTSDSNGFDCPSDISESECAQLRERHEASAEAMNQSIQENHDGSQVWAAGEIGSVPTVSGSYSTQSANWKNSDLAAHLPYTYSGTDTTTEGVVNKAFARSNINYINADSIWAWSETGVKFEAGSSGRAQLSGAGQYTGQVVAAGSASSSMTYKVALYDLTEGSSDPVNEEILWSPSSWILPTPATRQNEPFRVLFEEDLEEDHEYAFVTRVKTNATVLGTGTARADCWTTDRFEDYSADGYFQWTHLDINYI